MNPLVSIIVPSYNSSEYLAETLNSVLQQQYNNWECVIADDGSEDDTASVANRFCIKDRRFKFLPGTHQGAASTRNRAILNSSGKYILPLDSDDLISANYLSIAVPLLEKDNSLKIVYCKAERFGTITGLWKLPAFDPIRFAYDNPIFSAAVFRRTDFDITGGYDENLVYGLEDWELWINILKRGGNVYRIPKVCFYYRVRPGSFSSQMDQKKQATAKKQIYNKHQDYYDRFFSDPLTLLREKQTLVRQMWKNKIPRGLRKLYRRVVTGEWS